jgi:hypothetical protein
MKKRYIQPETTVYDMELQAVIADSALNVYDSSADPNSEVEISRRRSNLETDLSRCRTRGTEW